MLEFTFGEKTNALAVNQLVDNFRKVDWTGSLYLGYPLLASADETTLIDALLTSIEHGVVVFHFCDIENPLDNVDLIRNIVFNTIYNIIL